MGRPKKTAGRDHYKSFLAALQGQSAVEPPNRRKSTADVVVAVCSGSRDLSSRVGRHICLVTVTTDSKAAILDLSRRHHGSGRLRPDARALEMETGWNDWRLVPLTWNMTAGAPFEDGTCLHKGCLRLELERPIVMAAFRRHFTLLLDHLRFDEYLLGGRALRERHRLELSLDVPIRFHASDPRDPATWERVRDLYVLDPARDLSMLAALASAASVESNLQF